MIGSYNWKAMFTQSPETIKWLVLAWLAVIGAAKGLEPTLWETLGVGTAIERTLNAFYVIPVSKAKDEATVLKSIDLGRQLAGTGDGRLRAERRPPPT